MTLPSIENFDISFIRRTSVNLNAYEGDFEFTMLLNSLLGLIIVPNEIKEARGFTFDFWDKKLTEFRDLKGIFAKTTERVLERDKEIEIRKFYWLSGSNNERDISEIAIGEFFVRMRHSIAHFGIIPLAQPGNKTEWCGVILKNFREDTFPDGSKRLTKNFKICLMQEEIRTLANFISTKYLQTAGKKR